METEEEIKKKSSLVDETLLEIVRGTILASRDLGAKPVNLFIGADVAYYANNYPRTAYRLIGSGTVQVAMMKWSRKYGPNTSYSKSLRSFAQQVFVDEKYDGEWLDRLKIFYLFQQSAMGKSLESISQLYSGFMGERSLIDRAMEMDQEQVLGDDPDISDAVKLIAKAIEGQLVDTPVAMDFIHWSGSIIPIIFTIDHNSAPFIFRSDKQFLDKDENNLISQFGELCDASIQNNPSMPSFSGIRIPLLSGEERLIINEKENKDGPTAVQKLFTTANDYIEFLSEEDGLDNFTNAIRDDVAGAFGQFSSFTKQVVVNEIMYSVLLANERKNKKPDEDLLKKYARYLKFNTNSIVTGNSTFIIFTYDVDQLHKSTSRGEIAEIVTCGRPKHKFREALVYKHFSGLAEKQYRNHKILLKLEGGIRSIVPKTSGLTSTQLIKSIEKTVKEEIFRVKSELEGGKSKKLEESESNEASKKTDDVITVDVSLEAFDAQRREMASALPGVKIPSEDELIDFAQVAGHEFTKRILNTFVVPHLADPQYSKILPQGITLTGPPGTGKSYIAYALAKKAIEAGWVFVEWDPNAIKNKYVGSSEEGIRNIFDFFGSFDKLMIWTDEGDVAFGSGREGAGDSGVSQTLFSYILKFFGSASRIGRTILVTATNRYLNIDPALRSRLPLIIYMAQLDAQGIEEISRLRFKKVLKEIDPDIKFEGGIDNIANLIPKENSGLVGRQLLFGINCIVALARVESKDGKVLIKKDHLELLIRDMNTKMSEDSNSKGMDNESKMYATWRKNIFETPKPISSKPKSTKSKKPKSALKKDDDVVDL